MRFNFFIGKIALLLFCCGLCFSSFGQLSRDWAKDGGGGNVINGSKKSKDFIDVATDKHGNVYALAHAGGLATIDGQSTKDSSTEFVLISWNCNGGFRWMKSLGTVKNNSNFSEHARLTVDTMEGVYLSGSIILSSNDSAYIDNDTVLHSSSTTQSSLFLLKYNSQGAFQWMN